MKNYAYSICFFKHKTYFSHFHAKILINYSHNKNLKIFKYYKVRKENLLHPILLLNARRQNFLPKATC